MNHPIAGVCTEALLRASMGNTTARTVRNGARTEPRQYDYEVCVKAEIIRGPVVGILANGVMISFPNWTQNRPDFPIMVGGCPAVSPGEEVVRFQEGSLPYH
jgi:hypothetical protein